MVGSESASAERMRRLRDKKTSQCDIGVTQQLHLSDVEKEIEIDKEIENKYICPEVNSGQPQPKVGLVINAEEPYSLFPPNIVAQSMRPVIGIVTQIDAPRANPDQAERWLRLCGCETVFRVSSYTGEGIWQILEYLKEPGDVLPWDKKEAEKPRKVTSTKFGKKDA